MEVWTRILTRKEVECLAKINSEEAVSTEQQPHARKTEGGTLVAADRNEEEESRD